MQMGFADLWKHTSESSSIATLVTNRLDDGTVTRNKLTSSDAYENRFEKHGDY